MKFSCALYIIHVVLFGVFTCSTSGVETTSTSGGNTYGVEDNIVESSQNGIVSSGFEECLKKDSISCLQMQVFRMAKDFFDQPSYQIFSGLELVKSAENTEKSMSTSVESKNIEEKLEKSRSIQEKERALENYITDEAKNFFEKRNLNWNMAVLARNIANVAPQSIKKVASELMTEGRGRKKIMRILLPFLLGLKVKFTTILGLAYLGVILLAKKAIFVSLVSISISIFLLIKKMFSHKHGEVYPLGHGAGWQSHSDAGHVEYSSHSSPIAQHLAYSGSKPITKR